MFNISSLCPNSTFFIISPDTQTIGECFLKTCIMAPASLLFLITNIHVLFTSPNISRQYKSCVIQILRILSFKILVISNVQVYLTYFHGTTRKISIEDSALLITEVLVKVSLTLHFFNVMNKNMFTKYPIKLLVAFALFTLVNSIQFTNDTYLRPNFESLEFLLGLSYCLFETVYIVVALFTFSSRFKDNNTYLFRSLVEVRVNIQGEDSEFLVQEEEESVGQEEAISEEDMANYYSYLNMSWLKPVMEKARNNQIKLIKDLSRLPASLNVSGLCKKFMLKYQPQFGNRNPVIQPELILDADFMCEKAAEISDDDLTPEFTSKTRITLLKALLFTFGGEFFLLGLLKFVNDTLNFSGPLLLNQLVQFVEIKGESLQEGCLYATALFITSLISSLINVHFSNSMNKLTFKIRTVVISAIYNKSVLVKQSDLNRFSIGQIINFMSIDTDSVVNAFPSFHAFWSLPFQICVSLYLLYSQIGLSFLVGVAFILILIPVNKILSDYIGKIQTNLMLFKDLRVKLMTEFLHGVRVIKFYSWESYFMRRIADIRNKELKELRSKKLLDAGCVYFWACTPILISVATFTTYVLLGNKLLPSKVFTSLALFNMLINPLNSFPWVINGLVQAWVSLKRVQEFLSLDNLDWVKYYLFNELSVISISPSLTLDIKDGQFSWKKTESTIIDKVNFVAKKGHLIGVIGKVGSGKSTLIYSLMAELEKAGGKLRVDSTNCAKGFAYVGQDCWIKAGTIQENILFGSEMNEQFYARVVEACALTADLNMLPEGDQTYVGENGISLSGGQKTRVALARACYANKLDVYLFDDPLSAVDMHVGKHIYDKCVSGLLAGKTRILCTHHVEYLVNADLVVVFEEGRIVRSGTGAEIVGEYGYRADRKAGEESKESGELREELIEQLKVLDGKKLKRQDDEEKEQGEISFSVYNYYIIAIGICLTTLTLLSLLLMQTSRNLTDIWLSYWTQHHGSLNSTSNYPLNVSSFNDEDSDFFFTIYGSLCAANSVFTLFRSFLFAYSGVLAAKHIHECLITNLKKANLSFFQNTPSGRILNRLSSDMYAIDDSLPFILNIFLANMFGLLGMLTVTCYSLPWFTICLLPLSFIYYNIQNYYRWTSRELKRLSSVSLSPVYTHFHQTLIGLVTIRAFRKVRQFMDENERLVSDYIRASYVNMAASQWLSFRLQMISVAMITMVGFSAVFQHLYSSANASLIGLALSYILNVTGLLNGLISSFTETEKEMVSVERAHQLEKVESEDWQGVEEVSDDWPNRPSVEFKNVKLKYKADGLNALNGVSFYVRPGEKIGICGRTGSGKSSILTALFRGAELASGSIEIDGVNIRNLNLSDLRSRMSIIPQDPFLFAGSLRENLDPTGSKSDEDLWTALKKCHLDEKFSTSSTNGLDEQLDEKGQNLSGGEKQLICLARALLTNRRILCIDEATASVDFKTDALIQRTIRSQFVTTTVLTIAHRVQTILDCDSILAMSDGQVAEFDTVENLLSKPDSVFYKLVNNVDA